MQSVVVPAANLQQGHDQVVYIPLVSLQLAEFFQVIQNGFQPLYHVLSVSILVHCDEAQLVRSGILLIVKKIVLWKEKKSSYLCSSNTSNFQTTEGNLKI